MFQLQLAIIRPKTEQSPVPGLCSLFSLNYFNLLINTFCVIDSNKLLHYYNTTGWLLLKYIQLARKRAQ
jgi:archaellum component FlaD/FlaE